MPTPRPPPPAQANDPLKDKSALSIGDIAKWLVPSVAGLFAVTGYVVRTAHASLLGGGIESAEGSNYAAAAADFLYDLPAIAADLLLNTVGSPRSGSIDAPLGGHGFALGVAALIVSSAWWVPRLLERLGRPVPRLARLLPPAMLMLALLGRFAWFDLPIARIENVLIAGSDGNRASPGWQPACVGAGSVDGWICHRTKTLWLHIACSRDPTPPPGTKSTVDCSDFSYRDRRLVEGEFAARMLACAAIGLLAWRAGRSGSTRQAALALLAGFSMLSLPHAYGKLLRPTIFEYGRVELSVPLAQAISPGASAPVSKDAVVLAKRASAIDLLVVGMGQCVGTQSTYLVTKLWTVPNAQVLSVREIFRRDVIGWKLSQDQAANCPGLPAFPGGAR